MKFSIKPTASLSGLVLAGLLATVGASAIAQTPPAPTATPPAATGKSAGPHEHRMGRHDPAKMQARVAKHQAELKAKLKVTPAQEGAWTAFTAAMQPPAHMGQRPTPEQRAEFAKLTTPERIDKMREMRTRRMAEMSAAMDKRGEATKTFYAALTPEQKKTFDSERMTHGQRGGHRDHQRHHGRHGGEAMHKG